MTDPFTCMYSSVYPHCRLPSTSSSCNLWTHTTVVWRCSGQGVGLVIKRLQVRLPVVHCRFSTWMGDRLCAGKPSRYICKALSTLSQKSATVAENGETTAKFGDCRTFLRRSLFSATNCRSFLRQCGQALTSHLGQQLLSFSFRLVLDLPALEG